MSQQKSNVILALDVSSSSTGYAVLKGGRWRRSAVSFGTIKIPASPDLAGRLEKFRDEVEKIILQSKPDLVVIEDIFFLRSISTVKLLARFSGVALEVSRRLTKQEPCLVLSSTVRSKLECGKSKEEAFKFITDKYKLTDWKFKEHNDIADALCLALYAHKFRGVV